MSQETIHIPTPEQIDLEFEIAGLGSRFAAYLIDLLCMVGLFVLLLLLIVAVMGLSAVLPLGMGGLSGNPAAAWMIAVVLVMFFLVQWGYFLSLECVMRGQTPGKKALGIRVLQDNGLPIALRQAALRNLVRAADMLPPPFYLLAGLVMHFNAQGRRLGDIVAGTVVVRETFALGPSATQRSDWGAAWLTRLEQGKARQVILPHGQLSAEQLGLIDQFLKRRHALPEARRLDLARQILTPLLPALGDGWPVDPTDPEQTLHSILQHAQEAERLPPKTAAARPDERAKQELWQSFLPQVQRLLRGGRRTLRTLTADTLQQFMHDYRRLTVDLARGRSLGADTATLTLLNRLVVMGHNVLCGYAKPRSWPNSQRWLSVFPRLIRAHAWAVFLSSAMLFLPAAISYVALQWYPELAYDLVGEGFLDFSPTDEAHLHQIPSLFQPVAASAIVTNNIQVSLMAFSFGLTAGLGTCLVMLFNGVHLGAVFSWLSLQGHSHALWGWIMPHGGTELLAIALSGSAGLILARAIVAPGDVSRSIALKRAAPKALQIELGCMAMLVVAGLIEGFVSPSSLEFSARIAVLVLSLVGWLTYFMLGGRTGQVE